jgi:glycosyltransferase involved in cell wall biosynthesis
MKILYVITRAERGGAQSHVLDLIRSLQSQNEIALAVGDEEFLTKEARLLGVKVFILKHLVHPISPIQDIKAVLALRRILRDLKPDLVHAHSTKAGLVARAAAYFEGIPSVFTAHGWAFADGVSHNRRRLAVLLERVAARFSAAIITVSLADATLARKFRLPLGEKLTTIHNGVIDTLSFSPPNQSGTPTIVMVARFAKPKDHVLLLDALIGMPQPWQLVFVGDGPLEVEVKTQVSALKLEPFVKFLGARDDVLAILSSAHVFVLISQWEGLPITIIEAMRAGLPVIASDVGGVSELVVEGETGFLILRGDVAMLRNKIAGLLADSDLRLKLGLAGRKRFETYFQHQTMLESTWKVYQNVVQKFKLEES